MSVINQANTLDAEKEQQLQTDSLGKYCPALVPNQVVNSLRFPSKIWSESNVVYYLNKINVEHDFFW